MTAFLSACSRYAPARVVTNDELARMYSCEPAWIKESSGMEERHYADAESVVDMGVAAARQSLANHASPIGLVMVASGSADRQFPGAASSVAHALGLGNVPAIDVPMPSAGALFAMALAADLAARYGDVLVVASERMSSVVARPGTSTQVAVLFGDGAAACIVSRRSGSMEILDSVLHSDGAFAEALHLDHAAPMQMDGRTIIMQAARKIPQAITELLDRHSLAPQQIAMFVLHQANLHLLRQVAKGVGVAEERVFSNVARFGNTSSASVLIALSEWFDTCPRAAGDNIVLAAFGAGLHWGSVLLRVQ